MNSFEATRAPFMAHLSELRNRLLYAALVWILCSVVACYYAEEIYQFLAAPLLTQGSNVSPRHLIYTGLAEPFMVFMKLGLYTGFAIAFPFVALQLYLFLAPGLHAHEKKLIAPYIVAAPCLFVAGAALAYFGVMPVAWAFFLSFEELPGSSVAPLVLEARISEYVDLVCQFVIAFGLAFQLPIVLALLAHMGLVKSAALASKRRYAVVILLTIAAIFTPPDVISQLLLFIPLLLLYECSIIVCRRIEKNHARHKMDTGEPKRV